MDLVDGRNNRRPCVFRAFVCVSLTSLLALHVYAYFLSTSFGEPFDSDLAEVKYVVTQLTHGLSEVNHKQQQLYSEMERVTATLPSVAVAAERTKDALAPSLRRKHQHAADLLNYDYQRSDFAMESAGGRVLDTGDTVDHVRYESAVGWMLHSMAQMMCKGCDGARIMLRPGSLPGECWAFRGPRGQATVQLTGVTFVTGFSLEHISSDLSHTKEISSAPRNFIVEGLESRTDPSPHVFGQFEYDWQGNPIQYFEATNPSPMPYNLVRLRVLSNWGHPVYTCVYRLRVHGQLAPGQAPLPIQDTYTD